MNSLTYECMNVPYKYEYSQVSHATREPKFTTRYNSTTSEPSRMLPKLRALHKSVYLRGNLRHLTMITWWWRRRMRVVWVKEGWGCWEVR